MILIVLYLVFETLWAAIQLCWFVVCLVSGAVAGIVKGIRYHLARNEAKREAAKQEEG